MVYNKRTENFHKVRRYNSKIKIYPDGTRVATYSNVPIFAPPSGAEYTTDITAFDIPANYFYNLISYLKRPFRLSIQTKQINPRYAAFSDEAVIYDMLTEQQFGELFQILVKKKSPKSKSPKSPRADNVRRAQQKIYDIACMNEWSYFFTGTLGDVSFDPTSAKEAIEPLQNWLRNMVNRKGLKYILIAEYQKKGRIHFHGLINDALEAVDSGTRRVLGFDEPVKVSTLKRLGIDESKTQVVYNIPDWKFGWTTAIKPYNGAQGVSGYITKYITKDNKAIFGRYYWSSRNLVREPDIEYADVNYDDIKAQQYSVPNTKIDLKYYTFFPGQTDFHYNIKHTLDDDLDNDPAQMLVERFERMRKEELENEKNRLDL